ncbi:MAG: class I SAM-dependent methyltransferase [Deltaproteobacteria bacterium]|nr:class I SAM-dependent methyltransferase [Deltaproteobacteria bacterium]
METEKSGAWHEDDSFWSVLEPILFSDERLASASGDVEGVVALAGPAAGARVLDLCTGPGRHALELARRGFEVTGVDRNPAYLARAREAASEAGVQLELVCEDMRRFVREEAFDLLINLYTSFGYFDDEAENLQVAQNMCRCLRPGGAAVMELMGKEVLARIFQPRGWAEHGGVMLCEERSVEDWDWVRSRWIAYRDGRRHEFHVRHRLYSGREIADLLCRAGFAEVAVYGTLHGAPYDQKAERLVAVARKKAGPGVR